MIHERRQTITQYSRVFGTEIDLISDPVDGEGDSLFSFAAIQVVDEAFNYLLGHTHSFLDGFPVTMTANIASNASPMR
jgi:hypothetical protein